MLRSALVTSLAVFVLAGCQRSSHDTPSVHDKASDVASAGDQAAPAASLELAELSLTYLEQQAKAAGWSVLSSKKADHVVLMELEDGESDGYVDFYDFSEVARTVEGTALAAADVGSRKAVVVDVVDLGRDTDARELLDGLLDGGTPDTLTQAGVERALEARGFAVTRSTVDRQLAIGVDLVRVSAEHDDRTVNVLVHDYTALSAEGTVKVEGPHVLLVNVPDAKGKGQLLLDRL